jgi:TRAP-type mannitol/chloroaromatic compound transport system permease small subunit
MPMNVQFDRIERLVTIVGRAASLLILPIMAIIVYEVVARYAFSAPTSWSWLINRQIFGVLVIVAGSYTLIQRSHIRIEIFYERFPTSIKRLVGWISLAAALIFLGVLLWKGYVMALDSWQSRETATGVLKLPLYPLKIFIPLGAVLFILSCLAVYAGKKR